MSFENIASPQIEKVDINDLDIRENNPNEMTEQRTSGLEHSIEKFDYLVPILVNQDNIIIDGAHRYHALKRMGAKEITIVRKITKDMNELKLLSQTMNKLRGSHNLKKDVTEMSELMGYDANELEKLLGFNQSELDQMRQRLAEEDQAISNMMNEDNEDNEPNEIEEELDTQNKCPQCGYKW